MVEGSFTAVDSSEVALRRRPNDSLLWDLGGWVLVSVEDGRSHVIALDDYRRMPGYGNLESHVLHRMHSPDLVVYVWNYSKFNVNRHILSVKRVGTEDAWGLEELGFKSSRGNWPIFSRIAWACEHFTDHYTDYGAYTSSTRIFRIERVEPLVMDGLGLLRIHVAYGSFEITMHNYTDVCAQWSSVPDHGPISDDVVSLLGLHRGQLDVVEDEVNGTLQATQESIQKWREILLVVGDVSL
jgi:hypothetical protein